jgi:hypothetical protein
MANIVYDSFPADAMNGNAVTSNSYKAMLVTSAYIEDRGAHSKRSSITNEISGTGYTAGGAAVTVTVATNTTTHKTTLTIGQVSWPSSTLTARKMIVYRARGGAASADELVCCVDNGASDLVSSNTTMTWNASTWEIPLPAPV